jgi:transposase
MSLSRGILVVLWSAPISRMHGRWELTDEQWELIEPVLRPARRADNRGRPWHDTRAVLNGVLWVLGTGAQWRELPEKYPPFQTCHRRFQQWVRSGKLELVLRKLAEHLRAAGKLNLDEAFVDATFASAKKGASASVPHVGARARRSSLSPLITVFHSPYLSKALHRTKANSSKASSVGASSMNSRSGSSATKPTTRIRSTSGSQKNTASN